MGKHIKFVAAAGVAISLILIAFIFTHIGADTLGVWDGGEAQPFANEWTYHSDGASAVKLTLLPTKISAEQEVKAVYLKNVLPDNLAGNACILTRTSQQFIKVTVDGQLIYSYEPDDSYFGDVPASRWNIFELPANSAGKIIEVQLSSPYPGYAKIVNSITIGTKSQHLLAILKRYCSQLIIGFVLIVLGMVMVVSFLSFAKLSKKGLAFISLGAFITSTGVWMLGESRLLTLVSVPPMAVMVGQSIAVYLMPFFALLYVYWYVEFKRPLLLQLLGAYYALQLLVFLGLQAFRIASFSQVEQIGSASVIIGALLVLVKLVLEHRERKLKIRLFVCAIGVLAVFSELEAMAAFFTNSFYTARYYQLGVFAFSLVLYADGVRMMYEMYKSRSRLATMSELAYTDFLTGLYNRNAFEHYYANVDENSTEKYGVIQFDVNFLKAANDQYGHKSGDLLLQTCAESLRRVFGEKGRIFRMGGDEFAVVVKDADQKQLTSLLSDYADVMHSVDSSMPDIPFSVAYGSAVFDPAEDRNLYGTLNRADEVMYCRKRQQKEVAGIGR